MVALLLTVVCIDLLETRETRLQLKFRKTFIKGKIEAGGCIPQLFELGAQGFQLDLHRITLLDAGFTTLSSTSTHRLD